MLSYYNILQIGFTCIQNQKWRKFNSTERLQNNVFQRDVKYTWQWGRFSEPPSCPLPASSAGKRFSFHDPFEKTDQLMTILSVIYGKACQLHHEHHMNQSYINHKVQPSPIRNGSALATHSWNVLCWHPCSKPANLLGKQYSGQQHSFIIHCFYSAPLSLLHPSQVMTFLCVTIQRRRTQIQSIAASLLSKLWRDITWRSWSFLFIVQHLLSAAISPYKDQCKNQSMLTDMNVVHLNKKKGKKKYIITLGFHEKNEQVGSRAKFFFQ